MIMSLFLVLSVKSTLSQRSIKWFQIGKGTLEGVNTAVNLDKPFFFYQFYAEFFKK